MKKTFVLWYLFFLIAIGLFVSCKQKHNIEAKINGLENDTILIEYVPVSKLYEMDEPLQDTIYSNNGKFFYDIPSNEPILLLMFPRKGEFKRVSGHLYRPFEKYLAVLLKPEDRIHIEGELKDLYIDYKAKGSEFNEQYSLIRQGYIGKTSESVLIELRIDTLMSNKGDKELINDLFKKRNEISGVARIKQLEYIKNNWNKELSAFWLTYQPLDTLGKYYEDLSSQVREGIFKNMLERQFTKFRKYTKVREAELKIQEGKVAPDFTLKSLIGVDFSLNSVKDKYIVLDFWGSWCGPCIKGVPKMKEYYHKYKNQVEFIGIACNDTEDKWKKSVQENQLDWIQVINNEDIDLDVSVMYGVKSYPTKLILKKDRQIIAKFVGEGDDFYKKIDELMTF